MLDNLGEFQDLAVQADHLRETAQRMHSAGGVGTDTLLAMGALIGDLLDRQRRVRVEFADRFADFDKESNRALFRELFVPAGLSTNERK